MYNNSYEEYLNNVLGIQPNYESSFVNYSRNENMYNNMQMQNTYTMPSEQLEDMYPHIYNIINPLVIQTWNINIKPITNELIEQITDEIYDTISDHDKTVALNINLTNNVRGEKQTSEKESVEDKNDTRHSTEDRQTNYLLRDLIRILLVKNLIERQDTFPPPNRPPMYPPFPGAPGMRPPMRPPMGPRPPMGR